MRPTSRAPFRLTAFQSGTARDLRSGTGSTGRMRRYGEACTTHDQLKQRSVEILTEGMVKLGLLKGKPADLIKEKKHEQFYMHGLGHCWNRRA